MPVPTQQTGTLDRAEPTDVPGQGVCRSISRVYRRLVIDHFRGLRRLEIPDLAPVTLLSGRNNTGKTAVLEALFLHACGPRAAQFALTGLRPFRGAGFINIEISSDSSPWDSLFYDRDIKRPIRITGNVNEVETTVELAVRDDDILYPNQPSIQSPSNTPGGGAHSHSIEIRIGHHESVERFTQTVVPQAFAQAVAGPSGVQQMTGLSFQLDPPGEPLVQSQFLSSRSHMTQGELAQRYSNLKRRKRDREFLEALKAVEPAIRGLEVLVSEGQPTIHLDLGLETLLPLSLLGEGMSAAAEYATSIFEYRGGLILIDEFENGIHHSVLADLWVKIRRAVERTGTQVIASTHSRECVAAAYEAFQKQPHMLRLLRLRGSKESPAANSVTEYDIESLEGALEMNLDVR